VTLTDPAAPLAVDDAVAIEVLRPLYFAADGTRVPG
jgi:hypothetical protein